MLLNDWSARDIQGFESQPLGPNLAKSFMTSISPWVVTIEALRPFLVDPPAQQPEPDPYLRARRPWALDMHLDVELNRQPELRHEGERLVERRCAGGDSRAVREHERAVGAPHHVDLDDVDPGRGSGFDGCEAVLGRERSRSAMPDAHDTRRTAPQLEHVTPCGG